MYLDENHRYEIRIMCIELLPNGLTGDCYESLLELKKEKPYSSYKFGFAIVDTLTGLIPDDCNDWNDSVEEAMFDYEDNVLGQ